MTRRPAFHPRAHAAHERGIIVTGLSRAIGLAELHRDRIKASIDRAHDLIERDRAAGRDVSEDELKLATLRVTLAGQEQTLSGARRAAGLSEAA